MEPEIIFENKEFVAVNKPAGLLVHPTIALKDKTKRHTLTDWLAKKYPEIKTVGDDPKMRPGVVHRLDKDTSGVILVARNQKYFEYLKGLFQKHLIRKNYLALVWGKVEPKKGVINMPIGLKAGTTRRTVHGGKMQKEAVTEYEVAEYLRDPKTEEIFSLVKVYPRTGRTHQIRVHFAALHHSVIGDPLYGRKTNPFGLEKQFLHAEFLEFDTAENERVKIEAPLPDDLKAVLAGLEPASRVDPV